MTTPRSTLFRPSRSGVLASLRIVSVLPVLACSSSSGGAASTSDSGNLILNPGAEAAVGSSNGAPVATPDWTSTGEATALQYGASGYPSLTDPGPPDAGKNFFVGGQNDTHSSLTQSIDVTEYGTAIAEGGVTYVLSGWLGGYSDQTDYATLTVTFLSASKTSLGTAVIGPVTAAERANTTGFLEKSTTGTVPSGTESVGLVLAMVRQDGTANDGYADNVSLVFDGI